MEFPFIRLVLDRRTKQNELGRKYTINEFQITFWEEKKNLFRLCFRCRQSTNSCCFLHREKERSYVQMRKFTRKENEIKSNKILTNVFDLVVDDWMCRSRLESTNKSQRIPAEKQHSIETVHSSAQRIAFQHKTAIVFGCVRVQRAMCLSHLECFIAFHMCARRAQVNSLYRSLSLSLHSSLFARCLRLWMSVFVHSLSYSRLPHISLCLIVIRMKIQRKTKIRYDMYQCAMANDLNFVVLYARLSGDNFFNWICILYFATDSLFLLSLVAFYSIVQWLRCQFQF